MFEDHGDDYQAWENAYHTRQHEQAGTNEPSGWMSTIFFICCGLIVIWWLSS